MYIGADYSAIDPTETAAFSMDFTNDLGSGETINTATWTCVDITGLDTSASSRLIGSATTTGSIVTQRVGTCLAGSIYRLTATIVTSASQTLSLWSHVACVTPN